MTGKKIDLPRAAEAVGRLLLRDEPVLVAVSGGLDSMCLLHFMHVNGYCVTAAHFDHGLRDSSADDARFVQHWCNAQGIPFVCERGDVRVAARENGWSMEEAARRLRYDFLCRAMRETGCACIVTAHHLDDNAETILLNLVRGTGVAGLCGMRERQGDVVRPFLGQTRAELAAYVAKYGLPHVEDETNADADAAARNRVRLCVMPELQKINPRATEHICTAAQTLAQVDDALEREAQRRCAGVEMHENAVALPRRAFLDAPEGVRPKILFALCDRLGAPRADVRRAHIDAAQRLAEVPQNHGQVSLPGGLRLRREGEWLFLERTPQWKRVPLTKSIPVRWGQYELTLLDAPQGDGLSLRKTEQPLFVVPCVPQARLTLAGSRGARSVKRLCIDRGLSPAQRDTLPMLVIGGQTAAVWPLGADTAFLPQGGSAVFVRVQKVIAAADEPPV